MATFDISTHLLLSEDAQALVAGVLTAHNDAAELMLGLVSLDVDAMKASQVAMASLAVVYQVNYQVARADEGFFLDSVTKGPLTRKFRKEHISPEAAPLASAVLTALTPATNTYDPDAWDTVRSLR